MADTEKESGSHKLIAVVLTVFLVGVGIKYANRNDLPATDVSANKAQGIAESLPKGDADSSVDTIRALKQNAKKAAENARSAIGKLDEYKSKSEEEMIAFKEATAAEAIAAKKEFAKGIGEIKSEFSNFSTLMQGQFQNQQAPQAPTSQTFNENEWVKIPPINETTTPTQSVNVALEKVSSFSNIEEPNGYTVNNGFLLTESNVADASNLSVNEGGIVPVATIPENSPLLNGVTLSTLIGRVPKGGAVVEPYDFTIMTGNENLTSQLHHIPFLDNAIWRGKATGDRVLECIRGKIFSVTFVFTDGTILTDNSGTEDEPLAEISTPTGSNCIPGTYVSNTGQYLAMLSAAGGLAGLGEAISNNETINQVSSSGSIIERIDGDAGKFFAGKALSEGAQQAARIIQQEYNSSFASVVKASGLPMNMIATKQIEIDYDVNGRKVSYVNPEDYYE